ncbi:MAG: glycosyltransferase [Pseudomonadota bacterium]
MPGPATPLKLLADDGVLWDGETAHFPDADRRLRGRMPGETGVMALTVAVDRPDGLRAMLHRGDVAIPLRLCPRPGAAEALFCLQEPVDRLSLMPADGEPLRLGPVTLAPALPWDGLLPDWRVAGVRQPFSIDPAARLSVKADGAVEGWRGISIIGSIGVERTGDRFLCAPGAALRLSLGRRVGPGFATLTMNATAPAGAPLVPLVYADGAPANAGPINLVVRGPGGVVALPTLLRRRVSTLVLRPRERAGAVQLSALRLRGPLAPRPLRQLVAGAWPARRKPPLPAPAVARPIAHRATVVTPTKDANADLTRFTQTLFETAGDAVDLVLVDNGTTDPAALATLDHLAATARAKVLRDDRPFNFALMSNRGAAHGATAALIFANNDLVFTHEGWLPALLNALEMPDVGVAGAPLYYPDGSMQHAGMAFCGEARIAHRFDAPPGTPPGAETSVVPAVTGALLAIKTMTFQKLDGFRAARYPVLCNDVDLCLRAGELGLKTVIAWGAATVHAESRSIGQRRRRDDFARGGPQWRLDRAFEGDRMRHDWAHRLDGDPCYGRHRVRIIVP